ncbi:MAG: hypothetical protein H6695_18220 [Deferribacteres bacterium]|nr:hypothetical protein [candidate division KSB1 bacterium]MCB9512121.1 hypothetical protein [Deferribacteres bacterium]
MLAARGSRETDKGIERIKDTELIAKLRIQARQVASRAMLVAVILTLSSLLLPD